MSSYLNKNIYWKTFENAIKTHKLITMALIVLMGVSGGYVLTNQTPDIYAEHIKTADGYMQAVIANPTHDNIASAHYALGLEGDWAYRNPDVRARNYENYLDACKNVLVAYDSHYTEKGIQASIDEMKRQKKLV